MALAALYVKTSLKKDKIGKPQKVNTSINILWGYAASLGYQVEEIYHDVSKAGISRAERNRLIAECEQYNALFLTCAFHLNRTTRQFFSISNELEDKGLEIHTMDHGVISVTDNIPTLESLKVATYYCHLSMTDSVHDYTGIQNEVFQMYIRKETSWTVIDQYIDRLDQRKVTEQYELEKMIANKDKYDIILVSDFGNLSWDTSRFFNAREQLGKDIYSLEEGLLPFRKGIIV